MVFKKGDSNYTRIHGVWNDGKKLGPLSEEHRKKISNSLSGRNIGIDNPMFGKSPWNKGKPMLEHVKKALLKANIGSKHSKNHIKRIRDSHIGKRPYEMTNKTREKLRKIRIKQLENKYGNGFISIGKNEKEILDQLEIDYDSEIERQYPICGFFLDGYSIGLNIVFEVDERSHKYSKEKDKKRENIIISELNCEVIRILDY